MQTNVSIKKPHGFTKKEMHENSECSHYMVLLAHSSNIYII
jgi:hypothetical protein